MNRQEELLMEEGEEAGDGRAGVSLAIGDGGPAAISLTPDTDGTSVLIFENSQLGGSYVGDLLWNKDSKRGRPAPKCSPPLPHPLPFPAYYLSNRRSAVIQTHLEKVNAFPLSYRL